MNAAARPRVTPWATASLLCSVVVFCPVASLIAPLLGMKAIAEIRAKPGVGGLNLAVAGIIIGVISVLGWAGLATWWHYNVRLPMMEGPLAEIRAAQMGNPAVFRAAFVGDAAQATDEEIAVFLSAMARRWGVLRAITPDLSPDADASGEHRFHARVPYVFHFEQGVVVPARVELLLFADGLRPRWMSITLHDEMRGDLTFPTAQQGEVR